MPIYSNTPLNVGKTYRALTSNDSNSVNTSDWTLNGSGTNGVVSLSSAADKGTNGSSIGSGQYAVVLTDGNIQFNSQIPAGTRITISFWSGNFDMYTGYSNISDGHDLQLRDSASGSSSWGGVTGAKWVRDVSGDQYGDWTELASSTGVIDHSEIVNDNDLAFYLVSFVSTGAMYYKIEGLSDNNTSNTKILYDLKLTTGGAISTHDGDTTVYSPGLQFIDNISKQNVVLQSSATDLNAVSGTGFGGDPQRGKVISSDSDGVINTHRVGLSKHTGLQVNSNSDATSAVNNTWIRAIKIENILSNFGGISAKRAVHQGQYLINFVGYNPGSNDEDNFSILLNINLAPHETLTGGNAWQSPWVKTAGTFMRYSVIGKKPSSFDPLNDIVMKVVVNDSSNIYLSAAIFIKQVFSYRDIIITPISGGAKSPQLANTYSSTSWEIETGQSYVGSIPDPWKTSTTTVHTVTGATLEIEESKKRGLVPQIYHCSAFLPTSSGTDSWIPFSNQYWQDAEAGTSHPGAYFILAPVNGYLRELHVITQGNHNNSPRFSLYEITDPNLGLSFPDPPSTFSTTESGGLKGVKAAPQSNIAAGVLEVYDFTDSAENNGYGAKMVAGKIYGICWQSSSAYAVGSSMISVLVDWEH